MKHWILIASAAGARIFSSKGLTHELELVKELPNPDARKLSHELVSDGPGRINKSGAPGTRSATQAKTTAHEEAAVQFAHSIAHLLRGELDRRAYETLAIAAPPHFLGVLRPLLAKEVAQRLSETEAKDLADVPARELRQHIPTLLVPHLTPQ